MTFAGTGRGLATALQSYVPILSIGNVTYIGESGYCLRYYKSYIGKYHGTLSPIVTCGLTTQPSSINAFTVRRETGPTRNELQSHCVYHWYEFGRD